MNKPLKRALFVFSLVVTTVTAAAYVPATVARASTTTLTGYIWSSTIGWISLSGTAADSSPYGVSLNTTTGALTGDAWSDHIGWIQFGGLSGFPSGSGTTAANATVNLSGGGGGGGSGGGGDEESLRNSGFFIGVANASSGSGGGGSPTDTVTGWVRSLTLAAYDGDGWISLSGAGYGVIYNPSNQIFGGYSWSGDDLGWMSWNFGGNDIYSGSGCSPALGTCGGGSAVLPPVVTINASPDPVTSGSPTTLTWSATNMSAAYSPVGCTMASSPANTPTGSVASSSAGTATGAITTPTTFSLTCTNNSGNGSGSNSVLVATTTAGNSVSGIPLWLNNNPTQTNTHIHPTGTVALNWDTSLFDSLYATSTPICKEGYTSSGPTIPSGWVDGNPIPAAVSPNGSPLVTLSDLSVGLYSLKIDCVTTIGPRVASSSDSVTITVTTSTIHEQ